MSNFTMTFNKIQSLRNHMALHAKLLLTVGHASYVSFTCFQTLVCIVNICEKISWHQDHNVLTHWGWVTHICIRKQTTTASDKGLFPGRCQAIIWTNAGILLIGPLGTNFSETLVQIHICSFKKMHLKMLSGQWPPFCLGLNVLIFSIFSTAVIAAVCSAHWLDDSVTNLLTHLNKVTHIMCGHECHCWLLPNHW